MGGRGWARGAEVRPLSPQSTLATVVLVATVTATSLHVDQTDPSPSDLVAKLIHHRPILKVITVFCSTVWTQLDLGFMRIYSNTCAVKTLDSPSYQGEFFQRELLAHIAQILCLQPLDCFNGLVQLYFLQFVRILVSTTHQ